MEKGGRSGGADVEMWGEATKLLLGVTPSVVRRL